MSARGRGLKVVPKQEETPQDALGDASEDLRGVALLLDSMVLTGKAWEPEDAERDRALMIITYLIRQIAKHGRVL